MMSSHTLRPGPFQRNQGRRDIHNEQRNQGLHTYTSRSPEELIRTLTSWMSDAGKQIFYQDGTGLLRELVRHDFQRISAAIASAASNDTTEPYAISTPVISRSLTPASNNRPRSANSTHWSEGRSVTHSPGYAYDNVPHLPFYHEAGQSRSPAGDQNLGDLDHYSRFTSNHPTSAYQVCTSLKHISAKD